MIQFGFVVCGDGERDSLGFVCLEATAGTCFQGLQDDGYLGFCCMVCMFVCPL